MDERVYPAYKIAVISEVLREEGISVDALLEGTELQVAALRSADTKVSRRELLCVYRNAVNLATVPGLGLRVGNKLHVSEYGMYGFAMLSSANLREALDFSIRYHPMATPTVRMSLVPDDDEASVAFIMEDMLHEPALLQFNIELQFALVKSLFEDMLGEEFRFTRLEMTFELPAHLAQIEQYFGSPVTGGAAQNALHFHEWWLSRRLLRANSITAQSMRAVCDDILRQMQVRGDTVDSVRRLLSDDLRQYADLETTAQALQMPARTLRRRLSEQGASFQSILQSTREAFAIAYLQQTDMTIEDIADRIGFSDAANFRHAFKRWTGRPPSSFRKQQG